MVVHTAGLHAGEPDTYETDYTYNTNNERTSETDPDGGSTAWSYDTNGNVCQITKTAPSGSSLDSSKGTQSLAATTQYTYESRFNQVASVVDANGNETDYNYGTASSNPGGNLLTITYPTTSAGTATETFTYNSCGQVLTATTPDGVTQYTYNAATSYLTSVINDDGSGKLNAETQFTYDSYGNIAGVEDPNGNTVHISSNAMNQVMEIDGASGEFEQFSYDANGQLTLDTKRMPGGGLQQAKYVYMYGNGPILAVEAYTGTDGNANGLFTVPSDFLTTNYQYDANGNLTEMTDPLGHGTQYSYDERNLVYKQQDSLGNVVKYDYNVEGQLNKLTDELGHVSIYTYDGLDRLEEKLFPDSRYQTWTYDAGGRVTSLRTTAGNTISRSYDARNELTSENYGSTITNSYDLMGRLLTAAQGGSSLSYVYDALGRTTSFTDQSGHTSTYTYDLNGQRLTGTYPTGVEVQAAYDASGRPTTIKDGSGNTEATLSYDILDRPTGLALANSTSVSYSFDVLNRLGSINNTLGGTSTRNYSYVYDNASRITAVTEPRGTVSISGYSNRDEVTGVTEPSGSPFADQSFSYDAGFNRSNWTLGSSSTTYTVKNLNQYNAVSGATAPTWNSDGGLATFSGNTYSYDALGRLTEVDNSVGKYLYGYDPLGRRVKKVIENPSGTVLSTYQYHYDGGQVAVEYRPEVTWTYFGGFMRTDGTNKQWYYRDGQGSVSSVADNSGNMLENYEYNLQGQVQITNAAGAVETGSVIGNDLLYADYAYDPETGNYFCNARYYHPTLGRFISRDPLAGAEVSQGTNLYAYCGNDDANESVPSGMSVGYWQVSFGVSGSGGAQGNSSGFGSSARWIGGNSAAVSSGGPQSTTRPQASPSTPWYVINEGNYFDKMQDILGILSLGAGGEYEGAQMVNFTRLIYPIEKQVASAAQVAKMGPFSWAKYQPIEVTIKNGDMYLENGVHRVEVALQAEITSLPAYVSHMY